MVIRTANKQYQLEIFKPMPWTLALEARPRNVKQITIKPSAAVKNEKTKLPQLSPADTYIALTIEQALDVVARTLRITTEELLDDLYLSSSDSSISSDATELLDERDNFSKQDLLGIKMYDIFQTERNK